LPTATQNGHYDSEPLPRLLPSSLIVFYDYYDDFREAFGSRAAVEGKEEEEEALLFCVQPKEKAKCKIPLLLAHINHHLVQLYL